MPPDASTPEAGSYRRPDSLPELLAQLARKPSSPLAGGTDLVLMRADGMVDPSLDVLDIKAIAELQGVSCDAEGALVIGAATSLRDVANSPLLLHSAVADGAALVGGWQTRVRGTIGGNICRASPAGDTLPGVLVAAAQLELSSTGGTRVVPADAFFVAPGQTVRQPHELLTRILIPASIGTNAYVRFTNRLAMDLAVVGVAVHLELREGHCVAARIALSAAAPTPVLAPAAAQALIGTTLDPTSIQNAAALVLEAATPIDDGRGTRTHRRALLPVLAKRAISLALSRAQQRGPS